MEGARCGWCGTDPLYVAYHDEEWGRPETDGRALWEKLILDGFQAGLAWITILRKRDGFRNAFNGFHPEEIALWGEAEIERCLADPGIVRHRGKIEATIGNAQGYLEIERNGGFAPFIWSFVGGRPVQNAFASLEEVPVSDAASKSMSKALKKHGFKFCGPTICYAFMQACGLVNDHLIGCPAREACAGRGGARARRAGGLIRVPAGVPVAGACGGSPVGPETAGRSDARHAPDGTRVVLSAPLRPPPRSGSRPGPPAHPARPRHPCLPPKRRSPTPWPRRASEAP